MVAIHWIIRDKLGFSAIEAISALFLFSAVLSIYLPGLNHQLFLFQQRSQESQQWELMSHLAKVSPERREELNLTIERYHQLTNNPVISEYIDNTTIELAFQSGEHLIIQLVGVE